jgi:hypothetical protein
MPTPAPLVQLDSLWQRCHWPDDGGLKLLGLRGCSVVDGAIVANAGRFDHFDDTLFLFDVEKGRIDHVPCTAGQPGGYWDLKAGDAPWLRPGCQLFTRGIHRDEYPCLVQADDPAGTVAVLRDTSCTPAFPLYDGSASFDYCLYTGIHIHHAGQAAEPLVGIWSDGCTVVQDGDGDLWGIVKSYVWGTYAGQQNIWYGIAPYAWLEDDANRLLWGSRDKQAQEVTQLRAFLNAHDGAKLDASGPFDQAVDQAYRGHQRFNKALGDGICVNPDWCRPE